MTRNSYPRWLFWTCVYLFRKRPKSLSGWLKRFERTRQPWWKFKPCVWHNGVGRFWEITLDDQRACWERMTIKCDVGICTETGRIVGIKLWDELLNKDYREPAPFPPAATSEGADKG